MFRFLWQPIWIVSPRLLKILTGGFANGITIYPFVISRHKKQLDNEQYKRHEAIHIRQQLEMMIMPFYVWYALEYLYRLYKTGSKEKAYYAISFEQEAYANDCDENYLKNRRWYAFLQKKY